MRRLRVGTWMVDSPRGTSTRLERSRKVALAAPIAMVDARNGRVVSARRSAKKAKLWCGKQSAGDLVFVHEGDTLEVRERIRVAGEVRALRLSVDTRRVALVSYVAESRDFRVVVMELDGRVLAARTNTQVRSCAWWNDHLVLGLCDRAWTNAHGSTAELWTADLERCVERLHSDDAGLDVASEAGVVAACGIDMHLWWPGDSREPWSQPASIGGVPGEIDGAVLTRDGRLAAVTHDLWHEGEAQAAIFRVDALDAEPLLISDGTRRHVAQLTFSPDGSRLALRLGESAEVRVHSTCDAACVGKTDVPGLSAIAWRDDRTLLVGGAGLSAWTVA